MFVEPQLEVDDIQGHVLIGFGGGHQRLLGVRFRPERLAEARAALLPWVDKVTTTRQAAEARQERRTARLDGAPRPEDDRLRLALSLSGLGLGRLGAGLGPDDPLFRQGAAAGAFALGDEVDAAGRPLGWRVGDSEESTPDLFAVLGGDREEVVAGCAEELLHDLGDAVEVVYREDGRRLPGDSEHFGFVDGLSMPGVRGTLDGTVPLTERLYPEDHPLAATHSRPGQPLVWPGQFVFGYPTQRTDDVAPGPVVGEADPLLRNGSILVFRRLRQDIAAFRAGMQALAEAFTARGLPVDAATAAAWCVGRWPDGTPVSLSPQGPDPALSGDSVRRNGFAYVSPLAPATLRGPDGEPKEFPGAAADPLGRACPFFSHIRKVNPRDHAVDQGSSGVSLRSQMLRRGIPYGMAAVTDEEDRGLLFLAYQTSIANQFHRLMTLWANNAAAPLGEGIDPLIGAPPPGGRPLLRRVEAGAFKVRLPGRWIVATGAGYFFAPGVAALRRLFTAPDA